MVRIVAHAHVHMQINTHMQTRSSHTHTHIHTTHTTHCNTQTGNGENFVFSISPEVECYKWTGLNDLFVLSNNDCFAVGGGGEGFAFQLDDELDTGVSNRSATFDNPQLSSSEFFKCLNLEVFKLDSFGLAV